jgi:hypothetical protein
MKNAYWYWLGVAEGISNAQDGLPPTFERMFSRYSAGYVTGYWAEREVSHG